MNQAMLKYKEFLQEDFSVKHKITTNTEKQDLHIHDAFELIFVLSDNLYCDIGNHRYMATKGNVILLNNMDLHRLGMYKTGLNDRYILYFKSEYIEMLSSKETDLLECFYFRPFRCV